MRKGHALLLAALGASILLASCARDDPSEADAETQPPVDAPRLSVVVSIPPQAYFLERVGGERVSVYVLVGPGQSPATYEPTPKQMAALAEADAYFRIGVPFENTLAEKLASSLPDLQVVDTREGIELRRMSGGDGEDGARDPHIWLAPKLVKTQARTIGDALAVLDPEGEAAYRQNLALFEADLDEVDREIAEVLAPLRGSEMLVFHPAFGYFADAYGLVQVAVEIEGKGPSARQLARITEEARDRGARVVFVQAEFSTASAEAVADAIGGAVVAMDPLARDYLGNLRRMAEEVKMGLSAGGP